MVSCRRVFCSLASGSNGNCYYYRDCETEILVDIGISARETAKRLRLIGTEPSNIQGILITHEHDDHINGLENFVRSFGSEVFAGERTAAILSAAGCHGVSAGKSFSVGNISVFPFPVYHDAVQPLGYEINLSSGEKIVHITDTGRTDEEILETVRGSSHLVVESNYDSYMLETGNYPAFLKGRIRGSAGHLSNNAAGLLAAEAVSFGARNIFLAHLSEKNNLPGLALRKVRQTLSAKVPDKAPGRLAVLPRGRMSDVFEL